MPLLFIRSEVGVKMIAGGSDSRATGDPARLASTVRMSVTRVTPRFTTGACQPTGPPRFTTLGDNHEKQGRAAVRPSAKHGASWIALRIDWPCVGPVLSLSGARH